MNFRDTLVNKSLRKIISSMQAFRRVFSQVLVSLHMHFSHRVLAWWTWQSYKQWQDTCRPIMLSIYTTWPEHDRLRTQTSTPMTKAIEERIKVND